MQNKTAKAALGGRGGGSVSRRWWPNTSYFDSIMISFICSQNKAAAIVNITLILVLNLLHCQRVAYTPSLRHFTNFSFMVFVLSSYPPRTGTFLPKSYIIIMLLNQMNILHPFLIDLPPLLSTTDHTLFNYTLLLVSHFEYSIHSTCPLLFTQVLSQKIEHNL